MPGGASFSQDLSRNFACLSSTRPAKALSCITKRAASKCTRPAQKVREYRLATDVGASNLCENNLMSESAFRTLRGRAVPAVRADDVRHVSSFLASRQGGDTPDQGGRSISLKLLSGVCDVNADVLSTWLRATLVDALRQQGRLDRWREGNSFRDRVFQFAAGFPLPRGLGNADFDAFVAALE